MGKKFKVPGNDQLSVRIPGYGFITGGRTYDIELERIPEKEIPEMWWIKDEATEEVKESPKEESKVESKPVEDEPKEDAKTDGEVKPALDDNAEIKAKIKAEFTVKQLKEKAKEMNLSGYSIMKEDEIINLLVSSGFEG